MHRDIALHIGAVDVGRNRRRILVDDGIGGGEDLLGIIGRHVVGKGGRDRGQRGADALEVLVADHVLAVDILLDRGGDHFDFGLGLLHGPGAGGLDRDVERRCGAAIGQNLQRLIGGGESRLALEGNIERRAHEQHAGQPGHHGAGQPRERELAAMRDIAIGRLQRQRRAVLEARRTQKRVLAISLCSVHPVIPCAWPKPPDCHC